MRQPIFKRPSQRLQSAYTSTTSLHPYHLLFHPHNFAADVHKFKKCWTKTALFSAGAYIAVNLSYQWVQLLYRSCSQLLYRLISFFIIIALIALCA